jgi:allophanate hydrolase
MITATQIAGAVAAGTTSAEAVARETLARIAAYALIQPAVWIHRLAESEVLALARAVDARLAAGETLPLAGVPFAIKDNIDLAGSPTTAGCPDFAYDPAASATVVARMIAAGAVPVGKTNLDQFATGLNGTRSPYGAPACAFNRAYVSGGSSSGSAIAVAAGLVPIALGTDTAGSGRVPAAFNGLIGFKPSKGRWSTAGLVPACRSIDCITVFAQIPADAALVDAVVAGHDPADPWSRQRDERPLDLARIGVPLPQQRQFLGDLVAERLYAQALDRLVAMGAELVEIDLAPLSEAARLLYDGPWVAERSAALADFLQSHPGSIDPTVRSIVEGGLGRSAVEVFQGIYRLAELKTQSDALWRDINALCLPTAPTIYRISEMRSSPIALNSNLGLYTNFVNLLDMAAIAVPAGWRRNGTGFGVTLIGPAWSDRALIDHAARWCADDPFPHPPLDLETKVETVLLAVVGAHLEGMPLHWQLTSRSAKHVATTTTAPSYRLYAMADSVPPKPALIHDASGGAIAVEVYELDMASFGSFVAEVPPPLAIGTVTLADGSMVKGFVAEPRAIIGAADITDLGGWRAYIATRA